MVSIFSTCKAKHAKINNISDQKLKLFAADNINNDAYLIYQVQQNDSYWEIAQRFPNIRVKDLLAYNRFQFLKPKDKLRIIKK